MWPFTSINFGTCTLPEGRLFIRALLEGSLRGVGKLHRTAIFPCQIFQYMKGVNDRPGTPNYDLYRLALECTSKRLYPNYVNCNWTSQMNQYDQDTAVRQQVIDNLSEDQYNKLAQILKDDPAIAEFLGLEVVD